MRHIPVLILWLSITSCVSRNFKDSQPLLFNAIAVSPTDYPAVTKIYYKRGTGENQSQYSSTAFFISPRLMLTSGHSLQGNVHSVEVVVNGKLISLNPKIVLNDHKSTRQYLRDSNLEYESWDIAALVFSRDVSSHWLKIANNPVQRGDFFTIVGTGQNPVDNNWNHLIMFKAGFIVKATDDMMISYDMSMPGTPYTGSGDSGSPLLNQNGDVVGVHAGNYVKNNFIGSGYASNIFFQDTAVFWKNVSVEVGKRLPENNFRN